MAKQKIKIVILFVLIIIILVGVWQLYIKLERNKQTFSVDIYEYVSPQAINVININRDYNLDKLYIFDPSLKNLVQVLGYNLSFPIIISEYQNKEKVLISKVKQEQESEIIDYISTKIAPDFPPKVRKYKNTTILYFALPENKFLVCTFYKGIFAVSNHLKLIETFIDSDPENTFFSDENNNELISKIRTNAPICMFTKIKDNTLALDYSLQNDMIQLTGYILENKLKANNDTIGVDYSVIPHQIHLPDNICIDSIVVQQDKNPILVNIFLNKKNNFILNKTN